MQPNLLRPPPPPPPGDCHLTVLLGNIFCGGLCCPSVTHTRPCIAFPLLQISHLCVACDILSPRAVFLPGLVRYTIGNPNQTRQQKTCGNRYTSLRPRPRHTHPKIGAHPSGYTPDKQTDPNRHLPESVQGRLLPHPASWYTLQGRSYNFCIITLCAFPDMSRHGLVLPPPCIKAFVYYNCGLQAICPNPHATPTVGHGVRHPLPTICPIHRSLPPAAFLQSHVAMLQQLTHLHCHLVSPHHCLVAPRDSSP